MARTDEPKTAPEVRPLGVTVLPSFDAAPRLKPVAEPAPQPEPVAPAAPPPAESTPVPVTVAEVPHAHPGAHLHAQDPRGARALLRRRPGRAPLVAVPDTAATPAPPPVLAPVPEAVTPPAVAAAAVAPVAPVLAPVLAPPVAPAGPAIDALQQELQRERERADSAEAANAVLRRRLAQLDDELAQFRPRAIVPFEDNTD